MTISVGVGGVNHLVARMWVGVGGTWRVVTRTDVGVGGAWRLGYAAVAFSPTYAATSHAILPATATARITFDSDGHVYRLQSGLTTDMGQWLAGGSAANFDCFATITAEGGAGLFAGSTVGLKHMNLSPYWSCVQANFGVSSANLSVTIRPVGTSTVIDTIVIGLTSTVDI